MRSAYRNETYYLLDLSAGRRQDRVQATESPKPPGVSNAQNSATLPARIPWQRRDTAPADAAADRGPGYSGRVRVCRCAIAGGRRFRLVAPEFPRLGTDP